MDLFKVSRSRRAAHAAASLFTVFGALACGGRSTGVPILATASGDLAKAICAHVAECDPVALNAVFGGDSGACVSAYTQEGASEEDMTGVSVTSTFVESCALATNAETCAAFTSGKTVSACLWPAGTLADGAACISSAQCKGGVCTVASTGTCGVCGERSSTPGCNDDDDCPGDQVCMPSAGGTTEACATPAAVGDDCDGATRCGPLNSAYCAGVDPGSGNGTCALLPTSGQPCTFGCAPNLYCLGGTCQAPRYAPLGASCNGNVTGLSTPGSSDVLTICSGSSCVNGTCVPLGAEGADCGTSETPDCAGEMVCWNGRCATLGSVCN